MVSIGRGSSSTVPPEVEAILEALANALTGEGDEAEGEPEEPFKGFNRVAEEIQELRRRTGPARPTGATGAGDDTPPDEPQGSQREPEGTAETLEDTRLRHFFLDEARD